MWQWERFFFEFFGFFPFASAAHPFSSYGDQKQKRRKSGMLGLLDRKYFICVLKY
jgi:hypothetical protein